MKDEELLQIWHAFCQLVDESVAEQESSPRGIDFYPVLRLYGDDQGNIVTDREDSSFFSGALDALPLIERMRADIKVRKEGVKP